MVDPLLIPFLIVYAYAGWQTWRLMFLLDPSPQECEISQAMARGESMWPVLFFFLTCWPLLFLISWFNEDSGGTRVPVRESEV